MSAVPPRLPIEDAVDRLHAELGHRRLNKLWAKLEIFLGLLAAGGGLLLGVWSVTRPAEANLEGTGAALLLFALGGYLALAGSRSHLYQSNNRLAAYLAELIQQDKMGDSTSSPTDSKEDSS